MASSNRHWPSLFKSKLCNSHLQWQHHDITTFHHKNPYSSSSGCEERSPEPKPRWNPKPEQIRILEAIFNSGMVNPPRDEIRKIRAQLQEFGQVGDANVFYWFQNRKSRTKNKQRHLQGGAAARLHPRAPAASRPPASSSSSSSSSEQSTSSDHKTLLPQPPRPVMNPATAYPQCPGPADLGGGEESLLLPPSYCQHQGNCFSDAAADVAGINTTMTGAWGEVLIGDDGRRPKMQLIHLYAAAAATAAAAAAAAGVPNAAATVTSVNAAAATGFATPIYELQVLEEGGGSGGGGSATSSPSPLSSSKPIVFAAEAAFEVAADRVNVREAFGCGAILLDQSGLPVLTDEWGVTVYPLQQGASYYLV